jgi:hypothetical protein
MTTHLTPENTAIARNVLQELSQLLSASVDHQPSEERRLVTRAMASQFERAAKSIEYYENVIKSAAPSPAPQP